MNTSLMLGYNSCYTYLHFIMPERSPLTACGDKLNWASMKGLDIGFPLKPVLECINRGTCGNDSFMLTMSKSMRNIGL